MIPEMAEEGRKMNRNPLAILWNKTYQPINSMSYLLLFGLAMGNMGIYIDNMIDHILI